VAKTKTKVSFKPGRQKRKKRTKTHLAPSLVPVLKLLAAVVVIAAAVIGLLTIEKRLTESPQQAAYIELIGVPEWASEQLQQRVSDAALANGQDLRLDEDAAVAIQNNIASLVPWLAEPKVHVTHNSIQIRGRWRTPLAIVSHRQKEFYISSDLVVLDYVPIPELHFVRLTGLKPPTGNPKPGDTWQGDDLAAALVILTRIERMDYALMLEKPLLHEIDSVDVGNFEGRKSTRQPHVLLYSKEKTQIIWGAELGAWARHLEATDEEKLAKLFAYYEEYGTFSGVKYINLRDPQQYVPLPVDKY